MSSSIFDPEGPSTRSIYAPERQQNIYSHLPKHQKPDAAFMHRLDLPPPADVRQTQNHGHEAVLGPKVPVGVPEDIRLIHAHPDTSIPQEYWKTDVNLTWSDPRNELNRPKHGEQEQLHTAGDRKARELSSELFSHQRMAYTSTTHPHADLKSSSEHFLGTDSSAHDGPAAVQEKAGQNAHDRFCHNLTDSNESVLAMAHAPFQPEAAYQENPRRRSEKNFSDLFGASMGERKDVKTRQEATATMSCGWLDARAEIAERNKNPHADIPPSAWDKKEKELSSHVLPSDYQRGATRGPEEAGYKQVEASERVCWDTTGLMTQHSEIARRVQAKDYDRPQSAHNRKLEELSSAVITDKTHAPRGRGHGYQSAHEYEQIYLDAGNRTILTVAPSAGSPLQGHPHAQSARQRKLASLQGSLVFEES